MCLRWWRRRGHRRESFRATSTRAASARGTGTVAAAVVHRWRYAIAMHALVSVSISSPSPMSWRRGRSAFDRVGVVDKLHVITIHATAAWSDVVIGYGRQYAAAAAAPASPAPASGSVARLLHSTRQRKRTFQKRSTKPASSSANEDCETVAAEQRACSGAGGRCRLPLGLVGDSGTVGAVELLPAARGRATDRDERVAGGTLGN